MKTEIPNMKTGVVMVVEYGLTWAMNLLSGEKKLISNPALKPKS